MKKRIPLLVQISPRGQVTLPAEVRKALGMKPGDPLAVTWEEGCIVLAPVAVTTFERYTDERVAEFDQAAVMTPEELQRARQKWGL